MSDNTRLNQGTAGDVIATDDINGVKFQRVKLVHGEDGVNDGDISTVNPLPAALYGQTDDGSTIPVPVTSEGHIEVAIHSPRLPFGSLNAESLSPVFQIDAVYGLNNFLVTTTTGLAVGTGSGSGAVTGANNVFTCSTGTTQFSFGTLQSRRRLRYHPGQGTVGRFAGLFSTPAALSIVVAGFGTAESGYYYGYNGTSFGILHSTGGVREIHTFTVTTASTATNDYVVTLPNTETVTVTATNNGSTTRTAYEIARGTFPGWSAAAVGSTVIFVAASAGPVSGSFSLAQTGAATPAAGTDAETLAGVATTDTWYPQSSWNGDKLDGTGPSGITLNPQKGNVYQVGIQYLGFGTVSFQIEVVTSDNNPDFVTVHTLRFPNDRTTPHMTQPSFPFTMAAYSAGSTTDVSVSIGSAAGFVEGQIKHFGPRSSYYTLTAVSSSTSAYTPLFTVRNGLTFRGRPNQTVSRVLNIGGAAKSTTGLTTFFLLRNATLTGPTNFTQFYANSNSVWDTASTGCTFADNSQVVATFTVSETGDFNYAFSDREITIQPNESLTLAVRSVSSTATCVGSMNVREDQ